MGLNANRVFTVIYYSFCESGDLIRQILHNILQYDAVYVNLVMSFTMLIGTGVLTRACRYVLIIKSAEETVN